MALTEEAATLAERYYAAVGSFSDALRSFPESGLDWRASRRDWSACDIAFHVAYIDQVVGIRLTRVLAEVVPVLSGIDAQAAVEQFRKTPLDVSFALDALAATSALNVARIEELGEGQLSRHGVHSQGHDVTAGDLASFLGIHIEAHTRQLERVRAALENAGA